jgi:phosphoribosylglycinamide formyltransferase-1
LQAKVAIQPGDDEESLAARVLQVEHQIYPTAINWHLSGRLQFEQGKLHLDDKLVPPTGQKWEPS